MSVRLWPADYEKKDHLTKEEKSLLRKAENKMEEGHFAVNVDPVGMSTDDVHMGFIIVPSEGVLSFSINCKPFDSNKIEIYKQYVKFAEDRIYSRLTDSKILIVRNGDSKALKFPYKHMIVFPNDKNPMIERNLFHPDLDEFVCKQLFSNNRKTVFSFDIRQGCRVSYDETFSCINEKECVGIFERLAPEYTVVYKEKEEVQITTSEKIINERELQITGKELEFQTFFLDDYQVAQVNDLGTGHRVLLANPGAGKSVILLSKAFKYASLHKQSRVLLTCFNSNLSDAYVFKCGCANFGDNRNLYIMTFHKLVKRLFNECLNKNYDSNFASIEDIQECINKVKTGEITVRFKAIFIDEVQIFDPIYLELCYALLEDPEKGIFLMAGDLNQTVRSQSRNGDAPWKRINGVTLDFTGRVKYIEKNYRNSKQIGNYLNKMLRNMNRHMEQYNMISAGEFEYDSFVPGNHSGITLNVQAGVDRKIIRAKVLDAVKEITRKYNVGYSDIAVIFPVRKNSTLKYHFEYWVTSALDEEDIPYSIISTTRNGNQQRVKYSKTSGVVLSTIDSSLGLDFKAVIVAGLFPFNFVFSDNNKPNQIKSWDDVKLLDQSIREQIQINMRKIYTACSRARDILYIISDLQTDSPMELMLTEPLKENDDE